MLLFQQPHLLPWLYAPRINFTEAFSGQAFPSPQWSTLLHWQIHVNSCQTLKYCPLKLHLSRRRKLKKIKSWTVKSTNELFEFCCLFKIQAWNPNRNLFSLSLVNFRGLVCFFVACRFFKEKYLEFSFHSSMSSHFSNSLKLCSSRSRLLGNPLRREFRAA